MAETYEPMYYLTQPSYQELAQRCREFEARHAQLCAFIRDQQQRLDERDEALSLYASRITVLEAWKAEALSFHGDGIRPGHIDKGDEHHAAELALIHGLDGKGA